MGKVLLTAMVMVVALTPVEHDGVTYGPGLPDGDTFEVKETESVPLIAVGAVKLAKVDADGSAEADSTDATKTATAKKK